MIRTQTCCRKKDGGQILSMSWACGILANEKPKYGCPVTVCSADMSLRWEVEDRNIMKIKVKQIQGRVSMLKGKKKKAKKSKEQSHVSWLKFWIFILKNSLLFNNLYMNDIVSFWQFIWSLLILVYGRKQLREKLIGQVSFNDFTIGTVSDF